MCILQNYGYLLMIVTISEMAQYRFIGIGRDFVYCRPLPRLEEFEYRYADYIRYFVTTYNVPHVLRIYKDENSQHACLLDIPLMRIRVECQGRNKNLVLKEAAYRMIGQYQRLIFMNPYEHENEFN